MRIPLSVLCLATLLGAAPALAQACDPADETQSGLNACAGAEYGAEDAKLNAAYGEIVKRLADDQESRKLLQVSQRAWIAFRNAECAFATDGSKDGSIYPLLMAECLTGLTKARTQQLNVYLNCEEGDMSCPVPAAP